MNVGSMFLFGTLCHEPLRRVVLGGDAGVSVVSARLEGYAAHWVTGADYPMLVERDDAETIGVLVTGLSEDHVARLDFFEAGFAYDPVPVRVETDNGPVETCRYVASLSAVPGAPWVLSDWADLHGALWVAAAQEAMGYYGEITPDELAQRLPTIRLRAGSRVRAQTTAPATLRSDNHVADDVEITKARRPYANYFTLEEHDLRFRRFDGSFSQEVNRAGFVGGDAVTVLPYDPKADTVLLVEQFRMGPFLRGDPNPWMLEPIAGRVDPGEAVETTARREALEEAGLALGKLHYVSGHYPSPGAVTEYVYAYVAEADLAGVDGRVAGLVSEAENIRSHVVSFERFMDLVASDEAGVGPLVVSAYWLALNRARLRDPA
ncbi:NUDIX domain-containing protein [Maritimibacter dapengensis]|uniref:ADP-ribose pyrophosphatase n=1 Tax=Maritimibacter dapengensis TaxID=2836868 RepID=A0ABS6T307_9RHOB|nr:NUDIX domain-containing protein [Maritimibacter dapengensis]